MDDSGGHGPGSTDDVSFLRTEDMICMSCTTASARDASSGERVCLAAEGFGNRMCFLQGMGNKELPFDISVCVFVLEQALSVRALQEMVSSKSKETAGQSGHRTLLYGHAVLLRHSHSNMYLSCLSTQSSSSDKLAFDVGLQERAEGESCWWTIHPASKQRSEGEKVRVGDDLILVSVASERYLHIGAGAMVIASFQQTLWTVQPVSSGAIRQKSVGFVFGGDVLRLFHGDECLTIPPRDAEHSHKQNNQQLDRKRDRQRIDSKFSSVMYETGSVSSHARSLWKLEHTRTKWAEGFMQWGTPCRLRHITSGRYLAVTEDNQVVTFHRAVATEDTSAFLLRQSKDDRKFAETREDEGMGTADIKYGDSLVYVQHMKSGLWLSYQTFETKKRGVGRVEEKKAIMMVEGHMDDGLTMSRAQEEENKSARVIRKCTSLISRFVKALESLKTEGRNSPLWETISLAEVIKTLEDLIDYFAPPADDLDFEERQVRLKALRNRQDLFQEEGMIALILETIDRCSQWKSMRHLAHVIGEDSASKWNDMISYLYLLLAAMIQGNRANCSEFAASDRLDWLVDRLENQQSSTGVLDVLHCVLVDSPEALNVIKEQHIRTIISLIDKHGRDPKVLDVLCSLCVGNDVAVRSNQNLICENLLPGRDLLLQTRVVDYVFSMHPNIYVGCREGSAVFTRWYFEAVVDHVETMTHIHPHIRVGWANTEGYVPYPGGGEHWGANGVGDDLFSYSFDGVSLWTAGKPKRVRTTQTFQKGDIIGCMLDLSVPQISFSVNGVVVKGFFRDFNLDGMFYPVISVSAKVSIRFMLGGEHGRLKHGPPPGFSPVYESLLPKEQLRIEPCYHFGNIPKGHIMGLPESEEHVVFVPHPVETSHIQLPTYIENIREKLAENIHELWAMGKIELGWQWGERRDDGQRIHPCLTQFERLPGNERSYNLSLAHDTLRTLLALGYHVTYDPQYTQNNRLRTLKLPNNYLQPNGYKPTPLDLTALQLNEKMKELVEIMAENTHNVWAKERIKSGWTYGLNENLYNKRSPHLVPYSKVDEAIKKANRETASETVRTLMAYGYNLEPPTNESGESALTKDVTEKRIPMRTVRAELNYAVTTGKWYYEFEVMTPGYSKIGWTKISGDPSKELGQDGLSYAFDGYAGRKWHQGSESYGKIWQEGDVIGCMLDTVDKTISFSLNGELMMDRLGTEIAFKDIEINEGYVPALSLGSGQQAKINFGQDVNSLKFFTCCGLQEGYEPFCVNMTKPMPLWYGKDQPLFEPLKKVHPRLEVIKVPGGSSSPPCLKVHSKTYGTLERVCLEYLRLSMPVKCGYQFLSPSERKMNLENMRRDMGEALQRGYTEDQTEKRSLFRKKGTQARSMDDSHVEPGKKRKTKMKRGSSDTNLHDDFLTVPEKEKSGSKFSLIDKFSDVSKSISDKNQTGKRSKSPFSIFKKSKSREPSPGGMKKKVDESPLSTGSKTMPTKFHASSSEYSEESETESYILGPDLQIDTSAQKHKAIKKTMSEISYESGQFESETDIAELEAQMDIIDEFYYGVRIFPGQDPTYVYVGWVTPGFHMQNTEFDMKKIRNVVVCSLDMDNQIKSSVSRKNCYIVSAGDLQNRYGHQEEAGKRMTPGLLIGCHVDTSTGVLSFTVNGKEVANKFQVEPGAMLFPAVFCEPTNKEVLQFELGRTKTALPLSAILFRGGKHVQPQCPPRLDVQISKPYQWSRIPVSALKVHSLKLSDIRGWSMLCEEPVSMMAIHIPEEDRCLDILELKEHPELLKFHAMTLELYRAVCSHGNHRVSYEVVKHVDEKQLTYCIHSRYTPGPLRMGFHNLLIAVHLESLAKAKLTTQKEFIIPLAFETKSFSLFRNGNVDDLTATIKSTIPSLEESVSIRPKILEDMKPKAEGSSVLACPPFPLAYLKETMMTLLSTAVERGAGHIRDPIGGSNAELFVPLVKVVDNLLVMGLLTDEDIHQLLCLIDPTAFDETYNKEIEALAAEYAARGEELPHEVTNKKHGLLQIKLAEPVKKEVCCLLHHLCDCQLRHRVEAITAFADGFVGRCQNEQLRRYIDIKQADLPPALAARKTREFRCPPGEQMRALLSFRKEDLEHESLDPTKMQCPCSPELRQVLKDFHADLLRHCSHPGPMEDGEGDENADLEKKELSWGEKLLALIMSKEEEKGDDKDGEKPDSLSKLIIHTVINWAKKEFISDQSLVREMFSLLHRQYDAVGELIRSLDQAYVISQGSKDDITKLLKALGNVRALLQVQTSSDEEEILKASIWELADNKVFFQHPDLMLALGIHETVMQLMINTLSKAQHQTAVADPAQKRRSSVTSNPPEPEAAGAKDSAADMVVSCCRFLCYFCRTGRHNQRSMFEHLSYLLDNSCMLLSRPSLRGSCPLDVAYSSLMDNNELALALRESDLDKVAIYLSRCGQQSNQDLLAAGYPDIGWDPVEGERFLDFFRFCVWVNGDSVEENANLVVRLLIRRPECLGPALRGEGGGLLKAMKDGIMMSQQILASRDSETMKYLLAVTEAEDDDRGNFLMQSKFDFSTLPPEDDEDYIDMGAAILTFYSSLVDLLGRCAPDAETIKIGRSDSLRARAILRSLVSMEDLEGVLGLRFILPVSKPEQVVRDDGEIETVVPSDLPPGLLPIHKASVIMFMERVYEVSDQMTFFRLLEDCFLPDLRAATTLDASMSSESDMALALNRYLCNSVLPLLTTYGNYFRDADHASQLLDSTLHTVYRLSKCRSLTKNQRDTVSDFLVTFTSELRPPMMTSLLRKLVIDVPALTENTIVPLRVLTNHYERCGRYYGSGGWGSHGTANEEERRLTMMLFSGIFDSLAQRAYDPELFSKALPCLSAIACALSPEYSLSSQDENWFKQYSIESDGTYIPKPAETSRVKLNDQLSSITRDFAEHYHDAWGLLKVDAGWTYGPMYDEDQKIHPMLKKFQALSHNEQNKYLHPVETSLKAMISWSWTVELDSSRAVSKSQIKRKMSKMSAGDYTPRPVDLRNVTLTREMLNMAEELAKNTHDGWAKMKKQELESVGGGIHPKLVPYDVLTDREKRFDRERAQELVRFLTMHGFRIHRDLGQRKRDTTSRMSKDSEADSGVGVSTTEKRFAYSLLEKLLEYVDKAAWNMKKSKPASRFSRRNSYSTSSEDVKFFGKVVLPLVERYFRAHKNYFITNPIIPQMSGSASIKEKEMTASLFSKLALLLRQRITAFGHDVQISVRCLQMLVQAIDAKAVVRNSPEIVRSSLLPFFTFAADDLQQTVANLKIGRFSHVKGTITRGATSLNYVHMVLLPVLTSMFDHLGRNSFGADLLVGEQQLCCYRILNALYSLGTSSSTFVQRESINFELARHRPLLGECVASFASTFPVAFLEPQNNMFNKNSILYGIAEENIAAHSLEAKEVMDQLAETIPPLEKIIAEIEELAESGGKYNEAPHVIEVTLPMLCSYLPFWWTHGPDNIKKEEGKHVTSVTAVLMNSVLGNVLKLIRNNIGTKEAPWMTRIATRTQPIIVNATADMLEQHILPVAEKLRDNARKMEKEEEQYHIEMRSRSRDKEEQESTIQEHFQILVRDIYAFYPLLIKYVDLHRSHWLKNPLAEPEQLYLCVADVFNLWSKSHLFKKEEQNFVAQNEIDNMALIMPSQDKHSVSSPSDSKGAVFQPAGKGRRPRKVRMEHQTSLNVACLKRLLPIGLNMFGGQEQELVQQAKQKFVESTEHDESTGQLTIKESEGDIEEFLKASLETEEKPNEDESYKWQKTLYKKIGSKKDESTEYSIERSIIRVLAMAKVLQGLHWVEHPHASMKLAWKKVVSSQRKRAVMACFRMIPLHNLPRHRAINLFLKSYKTRWLEKEEPGHTTLIEDITGSVEEVEVPDEKEEVEEGPQPLGQLITAFSRAATTESTENLEKDFLYISYANIMSQSCHGDDEEEEEEEGDAAPSLQEQEMEKQKLLSEQARLADRGAAEMVLMYISASKGQWSDMVINTIELGISILRGGNVGVQQKMLHHLKEKKDVGFFTSVAGLMQQCSVLDLDAFERCNKAEGLGMGDGAATQNKNASDTIYTCKLFRFLQLLCEGHNLEFQNYLRTQAGNTTTVNVIICTVDYLLRLQESIMDFYWHYSGKDIIDPAGKESFMRAISVAAQVFCSISEYIQGPCAGNQLALAHSRLWDAVGGFLYIFAHMQDKLSKDPDQLELLREFMKLQKEMMIMLLSMLEGNVMNGPIGKQMVDTLVESSANFEMILKFFDIFLKMKDLTTSEAFKEFDTNKDGVISHKEFRRAMEAQKIYSEEEIEYIMMCVDANQDGRVDFNEFTDRFHDPAKDIGFNVAVLLSNLSEHMPNDPRLERFLDKARCVLDYFEPYMGRIEIMGSSSRIERVYFEITQSHIDQWEKPQIKDSKRAFLHGVVNEDGDKEKLEAFVNFCEDTIFEMQHATSISSDELQSFSIFSLFSRGGTVEGQPQSTGPGVVDLIKIGLGFLKDALVWFLYGLSPSNIKEKYRILRGMTFKEICVAFFKLNLNLTTSFMTFLFTVLCTFFRFILAMMRGDKTAEDTRRRSLVMDHPALYPGEKTLPLDGLGGEIVRLDEQQTTQSNAMEAFGLDIMKEEGEGGEIQYKVKPRKVEQQSSTEMSEDSTELTEGEQQTPTEEGATVDTPKVNGQAQPVPAQPAVRPTSIDTSGKSALNGPVPTPAGRVEFDDLEEKQATLEDEPPLEAVEKPIQLTKFILSLCARNFYNFKLIALALAFAINFILLFFKVTKAQSEIIGDGGEEGENGEDDDDSLEYLYISDHVSYLYPLLRLLALLHTFVAFSMMVAYNCLKVPLVVFKQEKEICRKLEFEGMWIAEQPSEDDLRGHWDKLVISTQCFPDKYWDKFVKKKVRNKYSEQYDYDQISLLLGMDKQDSLSIKDSPQSILLPSFLANINWQYQVWKWGIIFTDNSFLYIAWYFAFSVLGNFSPFFFAAHLLDVAICFKTLGTILQSVTHNGKQLVLTLMLLSIIVYVYSVIAFNFFRKFYVKEEDGEVDPKCHDMLTCYMYHLYVGVRAGGGIGDEIDPPDGDPYEMWRIIFDITFFFFVIIILLAIIQGLIIDAFGELRDQLEQVKEDLESSCFICGIGKDYFDKVPHGFETHVKYEHNFANYMFFLMHLINKPDTEYTGQESYVWELYQQRNWDFFPVGDCFRKQYEDESSGS